MKLLKILLSIIAVFVVTVYIIVFTPIGNSLLAPMIETKAKEATKLDLKLQNFSLGLSSLDITIALTPHNILHIQGDYSLFSQSLDINYDLRCEALEELQEVAKQPLHGIFHTSGTIKGDMAQLFIDGISDLAKSDTTYHLTLKEFNPTNITASIKQLDLATLLYMVGQKHYADATINSDIHLNNIQPHQLDGTITLTSTNGVFNQKVLQQELLIKAPKTTFKMQLDAKLQKETITYDYLFDSNLAKVKTNGDVTTQPLTFDIAYNAAVKELALLKPLTNADIRGKVALHGTLKGNQQNAKLHLKSDIASSDTTVDAILKEFKPATLTAKIQHLKLEKLFYMLKQPHYASGTFNLKADLTSLKPDNLQGVVTTSSNITPDHRYLTKAYQFKHPMPSTTIQTKTTSKLHKTLIDTALTLHSNLLKANIKQARFNLKDSSIESDYRVDIASLDKLYFVTDRHLRGGLVATGDLKKNKDLLFRAHSTIANGKLNLKLLNDNLHLTLEDMRTKKLLWMLIYPEIFDGGINATVDYNLALQKGDIVAKFDKGVFVHNKPFDLLKQFGHVDLYKEYFDGDANAKINKEHIFATFDLQSRKASIVSKKTKLNTKKSTIDSTITITAKKTPITVTLKGDIAKPRVGVDMEKFLSSEAGKRLEKKATKQLDKLFKKLF